MEELALIFKALSDTTRLRIIKLLEGGELCVCDLVSALQMVQPKVSFHLAILNRAGLVRRRRQGKWHYYELDVSDFFRRMLILSVIEKANPETSLRDKERLKTFLAQKKIPVL